MTVLLDSVGLIALWNDDDQWHEPAVATYTSLLQSRATLVSTAYVLLECGNAAARGKFRHSVDEYRCDLETARRLIHPARAQWEQAWSNYVHRNAANASIVDHFSFVVMRNRGIRRAFTNDGHFRAAGFETLF